MIWLVNYLHLHTCLAKHTVKTKKKKNPLVPRRISLFLPLSRRTVFRNMYHMYLCTGNISSDMYHQIRLTHDMVYMKGVCM